VREIGHQNPIHYIDYFVVVIFFHMFYFVIYARMEWQTVLKQTRLVLIHHDCREPNKASNKSDFHQPFEDDYV